MRNRCLIVALAALALAALPPPADAAKPRARPAAQKKSAPAAGGALYATRPEVMLEADAIAERRGLDRDWVRQTVGEARFVAQAARWVLPPASGSAKNWRIYRSRFIDPVRVNAGVAFWRANSALLERAQAEYGVPAEIIVGIIGVETIYGRDMGSFRVIDALCTLSFDFPQAHPRAAERRAFFLGELEHLLTLAQRSGSNVADFKGSFAGAMGMPQFMPSSWARHAVDFDSDGRIDLFASSADTIGSVANYFKAYGWQPGMPTHFAARFDAATLDMDALLAPDILPTFSAARMAAKGMLLDPAAAAHSGQLALVELQNGPDAAQYVVGTENFYVITRYNWSSYYAMAVIELGQEVAKAMRR